MKSVSEFPAHTLIKGISAKAALVAEGKTEEEIAASLGETFKLKDNRLTYFTKALGIAEANTENLYRVRLFQFNEGETIPEKAVQIEEIYYVAEFFKGPSEKKSEPVKTISRGGGGKKKDNKGPKSSPWGLSPEEIAEKKEASKRAAAAKAPKPE